jgi:hypothetical protein
MTNRETLQRKIAALLDHPSVYMGGPSRQSMSKADKIIKLLEERAPVNEPEMQDL